ncbi:ATP-binding protein [Photobacterium halotolerans]|uniref:ATP-binding protein n=1 Tax=Photobacterium halotolerans TaxID=265726 RepID=UPI0003FBFDF9|nr:ATP-binding protein [Photobacterium halotolerans]
MSSFLDYIKQSSNRHELPPRVVLYGTSKIGKTTFASNAPAPIFIPTEDGLSGISGVQAFPLCRSYQEVLNAANGLLTEDHPFKTVVIDSGDWLESLLHDHIAQAQGKNNIEDFGYGKGYGFACDEFVSFLNLLDRLRTEKQMMIIIINHHEVKQFNDPSSESYHRYSLKLHRGAQEKLQEWADVIGFATFKTMVLKESQGFNNSRNRVGGSGERILNLVEKPAWVAGNRYGLADDVPFTFEAFAAEFKDKTGRELA